MSDWMFDNPGWTMIFIITFLIGICVIAAIHDAKEDDILLKECLKDGTAHYKCVTMIRGSHSHTTVMPMVVPIR